MSQWFFPVSAVSNHRPASIFVRHLAQQLSALQSTVAATIRLWIARSRQRRHLAGLAEWDNDLLKDIGVSRDAALREAAKPFWRR